MGRFQFRDNGDVIRKSLELIRKKQGIRTLSSTIKHMVIKELEKCKNEEDSQELKRQLKKDIILEKNRIKTHEIYLYSNIIKRIMRMLINDNVDIKTIYEYKQETVKEMKDIDIIHTTKWDELEKVKEIELHLFRRKIFDVIQMGNVPIKIIINWNFEQIQIKYDEIRQR